MSIDSMRPDNRGEARIALPWPEKHLSPNARCHWAVKASAVSSARKTSYLLVRSAMRRRQGWDAVSLRFEFCPPSRRRYDMDNLIAQHKAAQDGIADALGIDDSKFIVSYRMGAPVKSGAVHVTITGEA